MLYSLPHSGLISAFSLTLIRNIVDTGLTLARSSNIWKQTDVYQLLLVDLVFLSYAVHILMVAVRRRVPSGYCR